MMTAQEFVAKAKDIATNYKTLYVMGCFGAPMNATNKKRYQNNHVYNRNSARRAMIQLASSDTFGFDCICLIKAILWGWSGNVNHMYGGALYASNGVPDISADATINKCKDVTTDFGVMTEGEVVWLSGHIGIYVGDGLVVECSPAYQNKVQFTALGNFGDKTGYSKRTWVKHGKLPWVDYTGCKSDYREGEKVNITLDMLKAGSEGAQVITLQRLLNANNSSWINKKDIDGIFGPKTEAAVAAFQKKKGLTTDGVVGVQTWSALLK